MSKFEKVKEKKKPHIDLMKQFTKEEMETPSDKSLGASKKFAWASPAKPRKILVLID